MTYRIALILALILATPATAQEWDPVSSAFDGTTLSFSKVKVFNTGVGFVDGIDDFGRAARIGPAEAPPAIVRRYGREPSPLVRDAVRELRTGRLERVLGGDFDLIS